MLPNRHKFQHAETVSSIPFFLLAGQHYSLQDKPYGVRGTLRPTRTKKARSEETNLRPMGGGPTAYNNKPMTSGNNYSLQEKTYGLRETLTRPAQQKQRGTQQIKMQ